MKSRIALLLFLFIAINFPVVAQEDEFKPLNQTEATTTSEDEFKSMDEDEFKPLDEGGDSSVACTSTCSSSCSETCPHAQEQNDAENRKLYWILAAFAATMLAGFFVRFKHVKRARTFFLLGSLLAFGFFNGGCPCIVSSYEFTFLSLFGYSDKWLDALWFLGLIPLTYIFGKVWCGWVCHLGALQEFMYHPGKIKLFRSVMAQKVMQILRYTIMIALIVQLAVMGSIYWCKIDPFLAVFNLQLNYSFEWTSGILLGLLLLTSLFSYRPFCRSVCPIGITLGWISYIPGASIIGIEGKCAGCKVCNNSCDIDAIIKKEKNSVLDNRECIMCGDCIDSCPQGGLKPLRKTGKNKVVIDCSKDCSIKLEKDFD
ncbi:MAG: hypothetical protein CVU05_03730 [Bacteroidetes bacterium HGW-Bacteroidetes-21]|jgi:ferredoxin|nr:MAG: hypothetical protein CVU05_03730 [Bacteroidetes bacterium HGW-Bacteroidetes-21]